jgi:hypothetical protein
MRTYNMRAAMDANGNPVLTHISNNPKLTYISVEDFLAKVEERGWKLDAHSLVINTEPEPTAPTSDPENTGDTVRCGHKGPDDVRCTDVEGHEGPHSNIDTLLMGWDDDLNLVDLEPAVPTIWMKEELADLGYRDLQKLAHFYDDVPSNQSTVALRSALEGKPKPKGD